jgi:ubiquinone/menaquinone biosynthesis C-methylase UbiE
VELPAHTAKIAGVFDRSASTYENVGVPFFGPIGEALVRRVAPRPGERAVDMGCGRGAALFPLAEAVGPGGHVTGVDVSPAMVEATDTEARDRGLAHVDLRIMDAGSPTLAPTAYHMVVSSLALFFLPEPVAALRAWRELLLPGGRLAVSTFCGRHPGWHVVEEVVRPFLPEHLARRDDDPNWPFASDAGVANLVRAAGYRGIRTSWFEVPTAFADPEQWLAWSWSHGGRARWEAIPESDRDRAEAAAAERLDGRRDPDGVIRFRQWVRFTLADRG